MQECCTYIIVLPMKWLMVDEDRCRINLISPCCMDVDTTGRNSAFTTGAHVCIPNKMEMASLFKEMIW